MENNISLTKIKRFSAQKETIFLVISFILMALTPFIIPATLPIKKSSLELIIQIILSIIILASAYLYEKKVNKKRIEADEILNYLGTINLQFAHVRSIFENIKKFPESKADFKLLLGLMAEKALGINNADWVIFRIIDLANKKVLIEYNQARGGKTLSKKNKINNKVPPGDISNEYVVLESSQENLGLKPYVFSRPKKLMKIKKPLWALLLII